MDFPPESVGLSAGTGERDFRATIQFPEAFTSPPKLAVPLTGVDFSNSAGSRIVIYAEDIEAHEFDLVVHTWADTQIFGVSGVWIAEVESPARQANENAQHCLKNRPRARAFRSGRRRRHKRESRYHVTGCDASRSRLLA
jgi:hypothetical protein